MFSNTGFSLGANILTKYLGEEKSETPFKAAVSICNPFDLVKANQKMTGMAKSVIYSRHLVKGLVRYYQRFLLWSESWFNGLETDIRLIKYHLLMVKRS